MASSRFSKLVRDFKDDAKPGSYKLGKRSLPEDVGPGDTAWFLAKDKGSWVFAAWATITGVEDAAQGRSAFINWGDEAGLVPKDARIPSAFVPAGSCTWDATCAEVTADFVRVLEDLDSPALLEGVELGALGALITRDALGTAHLPMEFIEPSPDNPRTCFEEGALVELAQSISEIGVNQPIVVRVHPEDEKRAQIVVGERRWRASRMAGLKHIPVTFAACGNADTLTRQVVENDQREGVSVLDEARAIHKLIEEHCRSVEEVALELGRSQPFVRGRKALLSLLPEIQRMLAAGLLGLGAATRLSKFPAEFQAELVAGGLCTKRWGEGKGVEPEAWSFSWVQELTRSISRLLAKAPWDLGAAFAGCRACAGCPSRSGAQIALLPDEVDADDRCLDQACFLRKIQASLEAYVEEVVEQIPGARVFDAEMRGALKKGDWYAGYFDASSKPWGVEGRPTWAELAPGTTRYVLGMAHLGGSMKHWVLLKKEEALAEVKQTNPIAHAVLTGEPNEASEDVARERERARLEKRESVRGWARGLDDTRAANVLLDLLRADDGDEENPRPTEGALGELLAWYLTSKLVVDSDVFEDRLRRFEDVAGQTFLGEEGAC